MELWGFLMRSRSVRLIVSVLSVVALAGAGLAAASAASADPPPPDWQPDVSVTTTDGVTATFETATSTYSPFDGTEFIDPVPAYRPNIVNASSETRWFGFGSDLYTQGTVEPLWSATGWRAAGDQITDVFWVEIPAGHAYSDASNNTWYRGMPAWSGHTITIYELDGPGTTTGTPQATEPQATALLSVTTPGRYVPGHLDQLDTGNLSAAMGTRLSVTSGGSTPEVFPGLTASVTATGLPPGDPLELWMVRDTNYAYFQILGGGLPVGAVKVGSATVGADGVLHAYFTVPPDTAYDPGGSPYQMVAGNRAERYWPAGTWDDFTVKDPPNQTPLSANGTATASIDLGATTLSVAYADVAATGTTTVTVSSTGPTAGGFSFASDPAVYYHLSSTVAAGTAATVCIDYDPADLPGTPPHLFHFDSVAGAWTDITTSATTGQVCGTTNSFSPFTLGRPDPVTLPFSGFLSPISMDAMNLATAGQAIPVVFSVGGDQGLGVVTATQFRKTGTVSNPTGELVDTVTAGKSGLKYDAQSGRYTYVWKTDKAWAKQSGQFVLTLSDGTTHTFEITFRK